jgi:hypothetical protein
MATKFDELRGLMTRAQAREQREVREIGFGVSGTSTKKVPTADAEQSHSKAMEMAREILKSDDPVTLDALRSILQIDPMRDTRDIKFRDCDPPLAEEVNQKLDSLMSRG